MSDAGNGGDRERLRIVERMERGEPIESAGEAAVRARYERLAQQIAQTPDVEPPPDLLARVLAGVRAAPPPRRAVWRRPHAWLAGGVAFAAAAVLLAWCTGAAPPAGDALAVQVIASGTHRGSGSAAVGDRLIARVSAGSGAVELRVYRDDREVVLRCPGDAGCRREGDALVGEVVVSEPGRYRIVRLAAARLPPPSPAGFDGDLQAVRAASGELVETTLRVE